MQLEKTFNLEDIIMNYNNPNRVITWSFKNRRTGSFAVYIDHLGNLFSIIRN